MKKDLAQTPGTPENGAVAQLDDASRASSSRPPAAISYAQALVFLDEMAELYTDLLEAERACEKPRADRVKWLRAAIADMELKLRTLKARDKQQIEEIAEMYRHLRQL